MAEERRVSTRRRREVYECGEIEGLGVVNDGAGDGDGDRGRRLLGLLLLRFVSPFPLLLLLVVLAFVRASVHRRCSLGAVREGFFWVGL